MLIARTDARAVEGMASALERARRYRDAGADVIFFEEGSPLSDASVEPLLHDMGAAWRRGDRTPVEDYLERHPELKDNADAVLRLVCEEICLREEAGLEVRIDEFVRRFPRWRAEVQSLLECRQILHEKADATAGMEHAEIARRKAPALEECNRECIAERKLHERGCGWCKVVRAGLPRLGQGQCNVGSASEPIVVQLRLVDDPPALRFGSKLLVRVVDAENEEELAREEIALKVDLDDDF